MHLGPSGGTCSRRTDRTDGGGGTRSFSSSTIEVQFISESACIKRRSGKYGNRIRMRKITWRHRLQTSEITCSRGRSGKCRKIISAISKGMQLQSAAGGGAVAALMTSHACAAPPFGADGKVYPRAPHWPQSARGSAHRAPAHHFLSRVLSRSPLNPTNHGSQQRLWWKDRQRSDAQRATGKHRQA